MFRKIIASAMRSLGALALSTDNIRIHYALLILAIFAVVSLPAPASAKEKLRYHYISLDEGLPPDVLFVMPAALLNDGRVVETGWSCGPEVCTPTTIIYHKGTTKSVGNVFVYAANNSGLIGGSIVDVNTFSEQAALIRPGRPPQLLPRAPDEITSHVRQVTDSGAVYVEYVDNKFVTRYYRYENGVITRLDLGPDFIGSLSANNRGIVAGTVFPNGPNNDRAFRYDPRTNVITKLDPLATENDSWGQAINNRGDVLGYSQIYLGLERIGVWRGQTFQTYFVEGTPQFPTISNRLRWNEAGLIVITNTEQPDLGSYVVPRPGVRLPLKDLTDVPLPAWTEILDINERGDLLGRGGSSQNFIEHDFLLKRIDDAAPIPAVGNVANLGTKVRRPSQKFCGRLSKTLPSVIKEWCGL